MKESGVPRMAMRALPQRGETVKGANQAVLLNKMFKADVISYAQRVSSAMTGLRGAAGRLQQDAEQFVRRVRNDGALSAKETIVRKANVFTAAYNTARAVMGTQEYSEALQQFGEEVSSIVSAYREPLAALGFALSEKGLTFSRKTVDSMNVVDLSWRLGEVEEAFRRVYDSAAGVLLEPLAAHMQFKGAGFYYNYRLCAVRDDTFQLFETGMLANYAV